MNIVITCLNLTILISKIAYFPVIATCLAEDLFFGPVADWTSAALVIAVRLAHSCGCRPWSTIFLLDHRRLVCVDVMVWVVHGSLWDLGDAILLYSEE